MSTLKDHSWEEHWRREVDQYAPQPSTADWAGMHQLLEGTSGTEGQRTIDQEPPTAAAASWQAIRELPWYQYLVLMAAIVTVGYWLGVRQSGEIGEATTEVHPATDSLPGVTFAPHVSINENRTFAKDGNRSAAARRDTTYFTQRVVRRASRNFPVAAAQARRIYIDTTYFLHANGNLSIRYDTVYSNGSTSSAEGKTYQPTEQPAPSGSTTVGAPSPAGVVTNAPASAPPVATDQEHKPGQPQRPTATGDSSSSGVYRPGRSPYLPVTLSVVVQPLPAWQPAPGTTYWEHRVQKLLESGRLKIKQTQRDNGHFPPINQRF